MKQHRFGAQRDYLERDWENRSESGGNFMVGGVYLVGMSLEKKASMRS
jgi:hypothetical protein